ncbi:hypothetical protein Rhe02_12360 [Rhizocola hellebori]|uniref:Uncharacterized protein n=1 Tax=Rhizocola hellebori TaxID=1392758 RepID=A0A8J3Q4A3_9ACTN|nr:hypothetical protein Rhe02_12360 [Rhizocola hellebori]
MRWLLALYPAAWRERYGPEMGQLLDDLKHRPWPARLAMAVDLARGAVDAHVTKESLMSTDTRRALKQGVVVGLLVWAALSVEIVLSNVVFPSREDDDTVSVLVAYLVIFASLAAVGILASRTAVSTGGLALAGAIAGALIGALTIGTFLAIDNMFLDIVSQQQTKIDALARSGQTSMRSFINHSLLSGIVFLTAFLALAGAGLAAFSGSLARVRRARVGKV